MPAQLVSAIGYIVAAATAGLALYYWRRSAGLYSLLVEGANRYEELRQRGTTLESAVLKGEEKARQHREQTQRLTQDLDDAREQAAELVRRLEAKEHEGRVISEKLELQKGFLEKQLAKAHAMLNVAEEQRLAAEGRVGGLEAELTTLRRAAHETKASLTQELMLREKDWQAKVLHAQKERESAEKKAKIASPETALELRRMKRKIAQYDRLYSSMKGLREMSEERNRNWEVALRKLSVYVIQETRPGNRVSEADAIGPLVGQALQAIGAQLIDDNEADQSGGAALTRSMDDDRADLDSEERHLAELALGGRLADDDLETT